MKTQPFSDIEYGKILDHIVIGCVDTVVAHRGKVLLVKRDQEPAKNYWWIFGGRVLKGENLKQAAKRGLARELRLEINNKERFAEIGTFNLIWPARREPISANGCHHLLIAHHIELTDNEKESIAIITANNDKYRWLEVDNLSDNEISPELMSILQLL